MDECVGDKRSLSFAESCLFFDEESDRPKRRKNINLGFESRFSGKRFGLTRAQRKGCRSFVELSLKMMNEGQLISMNPQRMQKKTNKRFRLDSFLVAQDTEKPKNVSSESDCSN